MSTEQLLRSLDSTGQPTFDQQRRADALLERIVVEPVTPPTRGLRPKSLWRVGAILAGGVVVAAVAIAVPGLSAQSAAVASWTPEAQAVAPADLAVAEAACRAQLSYVEGSDDIPLSLSERRGDVVAVLFYQDDPETASSCVVDLPKGSNSPGETATGSGGSSGAAMTAPAGGFIEGAIASYTLGGQALSVVSGSIGAGVSSITVHAAGEEAIATITDGRFAAWLPGSVFVDIGGDGGPDVITRYDLTLDDGTVIADASPALPE